MENVINVFDEQGTMHEVEVLDIFSVDGYDKEYILYTKNREVDGDNIEAFVSILKEVNDSYVLESIEDENEWNLVQQAIKEEGESDEVVGWGV